MTDGEVERAIEFLLKWQAEFNLKLDEMAESNKTLAESNKKLSDSNLIITRLTEELVADRQRVIQLIELQSRRLDRQDLWLKDHEDRLRRFEPGS